MMVTLGVRKMACWPQYYNGCRWEVVAVLGDDHVTTTQFRTRFSARVALCDAKKRGAPCIKLCVRKMECYPHSFQGCRWLVTYMDASGAFVTWSPYRTRALARQAFYDAVKGRITGIAAGVPRERQETPLF